MTQPLVAVNDPDFTLYIGDVAEVLVQLPDESVHCVVTSPPYWGLRDYGAEGQIGLEATPDEYVSRMVAVFAEVRRVLRADGTCWLNIGDSYAANRSYQVSDSKHQAHDFADSNAMNVPPGLKPKDLVGIPWRLAFALQTDGWYLRSDIIWSKPNPMPESVTDRPTKAHEYLFLLTKQPRYFFDQEAVREPFETKHAPGSRVTETQHYGAGNGGNAGLTAHLSDVKSRLREQSRPQAETLDVVDGDGVHVEADRVANEVAGTHLTSLGVGEDGATQLRGNADGQRPGLFGSDLRHTTSVTHTLDGSEGEAPRGPDGRRQTRVEGRDGSLQHRDGERWPNGGRNIRTVWEIATAPYPEAHFATFPPALVEPCIKAGCPQDGVVLDPFIGSGTTALVARKLGRHSIGIELNPDYARLAAQRLSQLSLLAEGAA